MLNRLFIAIGVLIILAIGAAFVLPGFIHWGDYRQRLETMAAEAFGAPVSIGGDIHLTLLPQPRLDFSDVRVGPEDHPNMEVARVEAEFPLLDFLRDNYHVTRLVLDQPAVNLAISEDGTLASGLKLGSAVNSRVSIADADVRDGALRLTDDRSGKTYAADALNGQLRLEAVRGPFSFQGTADFDRIGYTIRVGTGALDADGATTLSLYLAAADNSFTVESSGGITVSTSPRYMGDLSFRRPPARPASGEAADAGQGDFVLDGKIEATPDRVLLSTYTAVPDENRPATRLTGAAELKLGKGTAFNAVVSGGVVALPPRDATKELTDPPYELVRLLSELPLPPVPPVPGTIGLDVTELNLRAVSLRNLRLDAATDGQNWTVRDFAATLPGDTKLGLKGKITSTDGYPAFAGSVSLATDRLDLLAAQWRKPTDGNPLFNVSGSLDADVTLNGETLTLDAGTLAIAGIDQRFDAEIGLGAQRQLKLNARFTTLGEEETTALAALLPDVGGNGSFAATFPKGQLDLSASKAVLFGLDGTDLAASASWEGGVLEFSRLAAADLGGAAFEAKGTAFGTVAKPEISGSAAISVSDGSPAFITVLTALRATQPVRDYLARSLPAKLSVQLEAPAGDGSQAFTASGRLGTADMTLEAKLGSGIASALSAPVAAKLTLRSESPALMTAQLGLGNTPLLDDSTPLQLTASVEGTPANSYEAHVDLIGGNDRLSFAGNVVPRDFTRPTGDGNLEATLSDPTALLKALGTSGLHAPAIAGKARLQFTGLDTLALTEIDAGGTKGTLKLTRSGADATVQGTLALPEIDSAAILPLLVGSAGTLHTADQLWPTGPIDLGPAQRTTEGRIDVTSAAVHLPNGETLSGAQFGVDWDAQSIHLRSLEGKLRDGDVTVDVTVCCSGSIDPAKQVSGRVSLQGVDIAALGLPVLSSELAGRLTASAEFTGTGASLADVSASLSGSGTYSVAELSAAHFAPVVFRALSTSTKVVDITPETLTQAVNTALSAAPFEAATATGTFSIAGGVLRAPNLAISTAGARIFGGATIRLADLITDARYTMTPDPAMDETSVLDATTAEVSANIAGPLWALQTSYDTAGLVEGMKIKANEAELARLEQLKAEADARAKAAADEQARILAEQAASSSSEAERVSSEEAARQAFDEAASSASAAEASSSSSASAAAESSSSAAAESSSSAAAASSAAPSSSSAVSPTVLPAPVQRQTVQQAVDSFARRAPPPDPSSAQPMDLLGSP